MKPITVFFEGQVLIEFDSYKEFDIWRRATLVGNYEFYNGSIVHDPESFRSDWGRMDGTPMLIQDVPKELRTYVLLLT